MPRPSERTRSKRRIKGGLPGGSSTTHFRGKTANAPHCSVCGQQLAGVSNASALVAGKLNRGRRRIWRPRGGEVCSNCLARGLKQAVRKPE